jgi:membrane protein YqaA with SNARE-associated domain
LPLALVVRNTGQFGWPVAVATCGNYLGACTTYALARIAVRRLAPSSGASARRALAAVHRYGPPALLLSWVPLLGDALVAAAGATGIPFGVFSAWTVLGKAARYALIAWAAQP